MELKDKLILVKTFFKSMHVRHLREKNPTIYLKGRVIEKEGETEKEIFHPLGHPSNGCNS